MSGSIERGMRAGGESPTRGLCDLALVSMSFEGCITELQSCQLPKKLRSCYMTFVFDKFVQLAFVCANLLLVLYEAYKGALFGCAGITQK